MEGADQGSPDSTRQAADMGKVVEVILGVHEVTDLGRRGKQTPQDGVLEPEPGRFVEGEPARAPEPGGQRLWHRCRGREGSTIRTVADAARYRGSWS